mmetsp:Transcript_23485/g.66001  ORF Transcript_23485/g.66001 Transcript_23485/m.66001 type:complete len:262 (+) Transcript_23485:156-941(+)
MTTSSLPGDAVSSCSSQASLSSPLETKCGTCSLSLVEDWLLDISLAFCIAKMAAAARAASFSEKDILSRDSDTVAELKLVRLARPVARACESTGNVVVDLLPMSDARLGGMSDIDVLLLASKARLSFVGMWAALSGMSDDASMSTAFGFVCCPPLLVDFVIRACTFAHALSECRLLGEISGVATIVIGSSRFGHWSPAMCLRSARNSERSRSAHCRPRSCEPNTGSGAFDCSELAVMNGTDDGSCSWCACINIICITALRS